MSEINKERQEILEKIKKLEKTGDWFHDVENDPPSLPLYPNKIDYLGRNPIKKLKSKIVTKKAYEFVDGLIAAKQIVIKDVIGGENISEVKGGAFVTCNHFHPFDNLALSKVIDRFDKNKHKVYRIIKEGNYTNPPKGFDMFFKYCNTLPLSSRLDTMKKFMSAVEILSKKSFITINPEGYMWWNFKKPRPFKDGAFKFAAKFDRPIIPCFITMEDTENFDGDGLPVQAYTVHVGKPLYPNKELSYAKRAEELKEKNFAFCKEVYEKTYGIPLKYTCDENKKENVK